MGKMEIVISPGRDALCEIWQKATKRLRNAVLWDLEWKERAAYFENLESVTHSVFVGKLEGAPVLVCWLVPSRDFQDTCLVHLMICEEGLGIRDRTAHSNLITLCKGIRYLGSLYFWNAICFVPGKWYGARALLDSLKFNQGPGFHNACVCNRTRMSLVMYWQYIRQSFCPAHLEITHAD